uniref:Methyltransf_11 domain-containing protein n=1 Tax=Angiostrongylus cantonensis TaxID=6313 RepID=A0A0K0CYG8_ANGCA
MPLGDSRVQRRLSFFGWKKTSFHGRDVLLTGVLRDGSHSHPFLLIQNFRSCIRILRLSPFYKSQISPLFSYDVVVTSETIYNTDDYENLHDAFDYALSPNGVIWVAAKVFYFGVGGNVPTFVEFVESKGVFKVSTKESISSDIPRVILELKR